jgi:1-deoxy-D-xylulose-5-phosphate reductoisomerase
LNTRRIIILGSTGSIGTQTLEVITHLNALHERGGAPHRFQVVGLAAGKGAALLADQARRFGVRELAIAEPNGVALSGNLRAGPDAAERLVREVECDLVLAAIVGSAGLPATLAAVELGRDVALANKETLVAAGALVVPEAHRSGAKLLPVDSEHAAVWQCLQGVVADAPALRAAPRGVRRVILTASGGPFRTATHEQIASATREQALKHPTWSMGAKVTTDSASLMNKALEIIEAHWLFALPAEKIEAAVHPQSAAHALVEFDDASIVAQLATPDMRGPIQNALTWPARLASLVPPLAMGSAGDTQASRPQSLQFEAPDLERFPLLATAYRAIRTGGTSGSILNAANEEAVLAFLRDEIRFGRIPELVLEAIDAVPSTPLRSLQDALHADRHARAFVQSRLTRTVAATS